MKTEAQIAELDAAKKSRKGAASWLTRAARQCEEMRARDLRAVPISEYQFVVANFDKRLDTWDKLQEKVETLIDVNEMDDEIEAAADYREKTHGAMTDLFTAWAIAHPPVAPTDEEMSGTGSRSRTQAANLPKIDLPKFHGDVLKFRPFWQQFVACVDDHDLPDVTKFNYLLGLLKGDAKAVLDGLPVTGENYQEAKKIIEKRFGRKELNIFFILPINNHITSIH